MSAITHHISDEILAAYATATLPHAFSMVVASHVSMCPECRAALEAHHCVGGAVLETTDSVGLSGSFRDRVLSQIDNPFMPRPVRMRQRAGIFPAPVAEVLAGASPRWKPMALGVRQDILAMDQAGTVRLLYIPPGRAVPDHGHNGIEMTLVLQGSYSDETGRFGVGDVEMADEHLNHTPVADPGVACICLAATDAPLRFRSFISRLLQPVFRI